MSVNCWYFDTNELLSPDLFAQGLASLPWDDRLQRIERLRFDSDRRLNLGAGLLALHALRQAGAKDLTFACTESGKPYLPHHPDIHFNLSHSGAIAVCAVSDRPVGVDVEMLRSANWKVIRRFFHPKEILWLESSSDPDRDFTRLWTHKESFLKMTGTGFYRAPESFCAVPDTSYGSNFDNGDFDGSASDNCRASQFFYTEHFLPGYIICVCTGERPAASAEPVFMQWHYPAN